ncbi:MAG: hypothetical protein ACK46X_16340, partial [Candidatus Sericytochromatia bacterium]
MASKTGKLVLTGAVTGMLMAGCQTQPLASLGVSAAAGGQGGYSVLGNKNKRGGNDCGPGQTPTAPGAGDCEAPFAVHVRTGWDLSGSTNRVTGDAYVGDDFKVRGNRNAVTGDAYVKDQFDSNDNRHDIDRKRTGAVAPMNVGPHEFQASPGLSFKGDVDLNKLAVNGVLPSGVYVTTGTFKLSGKGFRGNVTLIGREIHISGHSNRLTPFVRNVLAVTDSMHLAGNSNSLTGLVDVTHEMKWSGHQNELAGVLQAGSFQWSGSQNAIKGQDMGYCAPQPAPTQPVSPEPVSTPTPAATATPTPPPTPSATPVPTPTPTATPTVPPVTPVSPAPTPTPPTPSPDPTATPTATPTTPATPTWTPTPTPAVTVDPGAEG